MSMISDLPQELLEEVLSKVKLKSIRALRFTCKKWNDLSKNQSFTEKQIVQAKKKQLKKFQMIMTMNDKVYLTSLNLDSNLDPYFSRKGKLKTLNYPYLDICRVLHCDGLLLCIIKDIREIRKLVVWNPYFGQTRLIKPSSSHHHSWDDNYALGYEKKKKSSHLSHKILRFEKDLYGSSSEGLFYVKRASYGVCEYEVYSFESNSWKVVLEVNPDWIILYPHRGLSLKGNTYWYAKCEHNDSDFLICFDFTRDRFGPRLPLPFHSCDYLDDHITLSSVGEEQLAVLFQSKRTLRIEIWVTSMIEPRDVSWNKLLFFAVDDLRRRLEDASFFIVQDKNVAVVYDMSRRIAYVIGKNGYFREVDLGHSANLESCPLVCSYVPSSVQIKHLT